MLKLLTRPVRWAIRRGYQPADGDPPPTECIVVRPGPAGARAATAVPAVVAELGEGFGGGLALVLPTYVGRAPLSSHRETVEELVTQLTDLPPTVAARPLVLVVGMQWRDDQHDEAIARLGQPSEIAASRGGVHLRRDRDAAGREESHAQRRVRGGHRPRPGGRGVGRRRRDVQHRLHRTAAGGLPRPGRAGLGRGEQGAEPNPYAAARLLHRGKQITKTPKFGYPHGCCMVIDAELAARGIPDRYTCEDDYFCFALLDPRHDNPLHRTHIVADAVSYHLTGGPAGEIRHRVNRSLLTAAVLMADFPPTSPAGTRMYFYGLWPLAPAARGQGLHFAAKKWLLKSIHFGWFSRVALGLAVRGVAGRPRREIPWSAYTRTRSNQRPRRSRCLPRSPRGTRMTDIAKYIKQRAQGKGVLNVLSGDVPHLLPRHRNKGAQRRRLAQAEVQPYAPAVQHDRDRDDERLQLPLLVLPHRHPRCRPANAMELYESLLDQLADFTGVIHPYLFNEPPLDRRLPAMVRMAKERTKASISIQTNGSKLTEELADELTRYATVVVNDYTTDLSVLEKVRRYPARPELVLVDRDPDATLTNRAGNVLGRPTVLLNQFCVRPFNEFYITQDGRVVLCCQDWSVQEVMGNVNDNTIEEIWNNEKYTARRESLLRKERTDLCAKCDFPGI